MAYSLTSPVTGAAQTGFTSPTYTVVADQAPDGNGKQYSVSALGGTQTGVTTALVDSPFMINFVKPASFKSLPALNANGQLSSVPRNRWKLIARKGVSPASGQSPVPMVISCDFDVPAGATAYDAANIRAALSLFIGALSQQSAGIGDTLITGVV